MRLIACFLVAAAAILLSSAGGHGQPDSIADARKLLADPKPQVRLRAALALALAKQDDEQAIDVLINLFPVLPHDERVQAERALRDLAGEWSPAPALQGDDELSRKIRLEAWAGWWRTMNGPALLAEFRQRTSGQNEDKRKLPSATARLLAIRKPPGAAVALLQYLPLADDPLMKEEIGKALVKLVMLDGRTDPEMLKALSDPLPVRRIAAAEALAEGCGAEQWPGLRMLLKDADPQVRLSVAMALVYAQDKAAVPALIELVAELPRAQAWEAEDLLHFLAGDKAPPRLSKDTPAARKKLRDDWQVWWKSSAAAVNMAELAKNRGGMGLTLVAEMTLKGAKGFAVAGGAVPGAAPVGATDRVVALDRAGQPQWQIDNLSYPLDVQRLSGNRVLIAEYGARRITERDSKGAILWQVSVPASPINVQRLTNGNTFITLFINGPAGDAALIEVDPTGKTVASINVGNVRAGQGGLAGQSTLLVGGHKMPDGRIVYVTLDGTCVWLDAAGKEVKRFFVPVFNSGTVYAIMGNIDVTDKGHIIVALNDNTVAEFDGDGKKIWQANLPANRATRLPNGNTLVAALNGGVVEVDSTGRTVWQYTPPAGYQPLRARRH